MTITKRNTTNTKLTGELMGNTKKIKNVIASSFGIELSRDEMENFMEVANDFTNGEYASFTFIKTLEDVFNFFMENNVMTVNN